MERQKGSRVIPRHAAEATTVASFRTWRSSRHPAAQSPEPSPDPSTRRRSDEAARRRNGVASGSKAKRAGVAVWEGCFVRECPVFGDFLTFFLSRRDAARFWAWVGWRRFVRICPDFRIFGGCGRVEGLDGVLPLPPVHRLADGLGGWLGLLAGWGCWLRSSWCFFFKFEKLSKEVRDASRSDYVIPASRPRRVSQS